MTIMQLVRKFLAYSRTRNFFIIFTRNSHWTSSWVSSIQSTHTYYFLKIHLNVILQSTSGLPVGLFLSNFPNIILCGFLILTSR